MTIYHKHHIVPKHMGGTDDPSNLISVTIEQHANLHKQLWEDLHHYEDYIAWKTLFGYITISEAKKLAQRLGSKKGGLIGGPIAGKKCKEQKIGYISLTKKENKKYGKKTVELKKGIHSPDWDKSIGGKKGGQKCKENGIGFLSKDFDKGAASRGKKWISKLDKEIKIYPKEIDKYIKKGWRLGRKDGFRNV